jgi:hypothetical protein
MVVTTFMTMLCLAGVAFCVRFLAALGKECKARSTLLLAAPAYRLKPSRNPAAAGTQYQLIERPGNGLDVDRSLTPLARSATLTDSEKGYF